MEELNLMSTRHLVLNNFARWCAFSSTRSGCPLKSRADIYPLIDLPDYSEVLKGTEPITKTQFQKWHEESACLIQKKRPEMNIGWSTKLINVYLKSLVYGGLIGRPGLAELIHPPIDGGLWEGIREKYKDFENILSNTHSISKIKDIANYAQYQVIMQGIELVAKAENCSLMEVEKLWKGTELKNHRKLNNELV